MKIIGCQQNTPEWFTARCGIPTASNFDCLITTKGEPSKQRMKYLYQLAGEKITGKPEETYQNANMLRGQDVEDEARKLYEVITGQEVTQVGLCITTGKTIYAASPDGMVGEDGLLEIKCPIISTHVSYLLDGTLPTDYIQQCQGQLLVTGRKHVDFLSYYPGLKPLLIRVRRDEVFLKALKGEVEKFCIELNVVAEKIR